METTDMRRRNLSGIYIFDTLPHDQRRKPTCLEDCMVRTRLNWLWKQYGGSEPYNGMEFLRNVAKKINETFCDVWSYLKDEEKEGLSCPFVETSEVSASRLINDIDRKCMLLHDIAVMMELCAQGSEADPNYQPDND